jgi:hypothetical protein
MTRPPIEEPVPMGMCKDCADPVCSHVMTRIKALETAAERLCDALVEPTDSDCPTCIPVLKGAYGPIEKHQPDCEFAALHDLLPKKEAHDETTG